MNFKYALVRLRAGDKVKLPAWGGYWAWDPDKETIYMHTKDREALDIRETDRLLYTLGNILSDAWIIADETNTPILGGVALFDFSVALEYLKRGHQMTRRGWADKSQYVERATDIRYVRKLNGVARVVLDASGNCSLAAVNASGTQIGWIPTAVDILAEDWMFVEAVKK